MSFQDLDFKSDRAYLSKPRKPAPEVSPARVKLMGKLMLVGTLVTLLGFSVSNWQPSAKSADSTPKSARLHYSLSLPEPAPRLEQDLQNAAAEAESTDWETVVIKSGDTLASIFSKQGIPATTTHQIARLNEQTKTLRYIQPGEKIELLIDDERGLRQMKYIPDITRTLLIQLNEQGDYDSRIINYQLEFHAVWTTRASVES